MATRTRAAVGALFGVLVTVVTACSSPSSVERPIVRALAVAATARLVGLPDTVQVRLRVLNIGTDTQTVEWDYCKASAPQGAIRVYQPGTGRLVWSWIAAYNSSICALQIDGTVLNPGDSAIVWGGVPVSDILGDSLPGGPYDLTLSPFALVPPDSSEISLGEFTLTR